MKGNAASGMPPGGGQNPGDQDKEKQKEDWNLRDEGEVGNGDFTTNKPFLLGENRVEYTPNTGDFLLVTLYSRCDPLGMVELEPSVLTEVRSRKRKMLSVYN